jgi:hypothetical protein
LDLKLVAEGQQFIDLGEDAALSAKAPYPSLPKIPAVADKVGTARRAVRSPLYRFLQNRSQSVAQHGFQQAGLVSGLALAGA